MQISYQTRRISNNLGAQTAFAWKYWDLLNNAIELPSKRGSIQRKAEKLKAEKLKEGEKGGFRQAHVLWHLKRRFEEKDEIRTNCSKTLRVAWNLKAEDRQEAKTGGIDRRAATPCFGNVTGELRYECRKNYGYVAKITVSWGKITPSYAYLRWGYPPNKA